MAGSLGVIFHLEMRPIPPGIWVFEDSRAIYRGNVEMTYRYPDQGSIDAFGGVAPLRYTVFMVYVMHIPTEYRYRGPPASPALLPAPVPAHHPRPHQQTTSRSATHAPVPDSTPPRATAPAYAGLPAARMRGRVPATPIHSEYVPAPQAKEEEFATFAPGFRYGGSYVRPPLRHSGQIPSPGSSEEATVRKDIDAMARRDLDAPGPSSRLPAKKRDRVPTIEISSSDDPELDPSEGSC